MFDLRRRQWHPTPVLLPGKSHGRRSLAGCSPWCCKESDMTEQFHFHFSLSCIGEGNGNPLQRSCLENPRNSGAWWAAIYGAAQSRTRLKRLGSSSKAASADALSTTHWWEKLTRSFLKTDRCAVIKTVVFPRAFLHGILQLIKVLSVRLVLKLCHKILIG